MTARSSDFTWTEWAVQIHFPGGVTTVDHVGEHEARLHLERLLAEPTQRADRIELVSRVNVQGAWQAVATCGCGCQPDQDCMCGSHCACSDGCPVCDAVEAQHAPGQEGT